MKFNQAINETRMNSNEREANIKKWNFSQKKMWEKLIKYTEVDRNDVNTFTKFAKYFYDYVNNHGRTPTMKQVRKYCDV